jgi:hypothetical protein
MDWPKKRTLLIGARHLVDFMAAERIIKRFTEDVEKLGQKPGRYNFIGYITPNDRHIAVWYTANQITVYFNED